MVSIRRRKLLAITCAEQKSVKKENSAEETGSLGLPDAPSEYDFKPKEETVSENGLDSSNVAASCSSKEQVVQQFSEVKRRKWYRRKHFENQPCIMRGVYFKNLKWQAAIKVDKKQIHLGTVRSQEEAARLYDRAAFMCGREPNFELSEAEKQELSKFSWEEFLAMTRLAINSKKNQRRRVKKFNDSNWKGDKENDTCFLPSEEEANDMIAAC